jgi:hypothetical protein
VESAALCPPDRVIAGQPSQSTREGRTIIAAVGVD